MNPYFSFNLFTFFILYPNFGGAKVIKKIEKTLYILSYSASVSPFLMYANSSI